MDNLVGLVNNLQKICTALADDGADRCLPTIWDSLPTIVVVGGQSSGKSSVLESIVGHDFLPRGSGIVTRRPLVLQLYKIQQGQQDYAQFLHTGNQRFTDFSMVRKEIQEETDRATGKKKNISPLPINLSIYSPNVVNLTLIDLPGLTKVATDGQPESIVKDIEHMVHSYVEKPNCMILPITPANQDVATSDAIRLAREVDPAGERTFPVLTKLDLMDNGTDALEVLEGRSYRLYHPWVGVVNRSQGDINRKVDMFYARRKETDFFANSPYYAKIASKMGSEYLAKLLSKQLETVIKARIPSIMSSIEQSSHELEAELDSLGKPIADDAGVRLYTILELCRAFERIFVQQLDGGSTAARISTIFEKQLPTAMRKIPFDRQLSLENVHRVVCEADGYEPHLIAPEKAYRRLIQSSLNSFKVPAAATVDTAHLQLKELVRNSIMQTQELKQFPRLTAEISSAANEALERFREESKKTVMRLVDMESSFLTVEFFRKLKFEENKGENPLRGTRERYCESDYRTIASNVSSYIGIVGNSLNNTIPKAVVHCQLRQSKCSLLDRLYCHVSQKKGGELGVLLGENPAIMERRNEYRRRLDLCNSAREEIQSVMWSR